MTAQQKGEKSHKKTSGHNDSPVPPHDDALVQLQEDLRKAIHERDEYITLLQRERADFINFKKRVEEEKKDIVTFGQSIILLRWIPLYEVFSKAFDHLPEDLKEHDWVRGIQQIKQLFDKLFDDLRIVKIPTVHTSFDSSKHEALLQVSGEKGMVLQEIEAGYMFQGKVLKPAKVAVGNGELAQEQESEEKKNDSLGEGNSQDIHSEM